MNSLALDSLMNAKNVNLKLIENYLEPSLVLGRDISAEQLTTENCSLLWGVSSSLIPYGTLNIPLSTFESNLILRVTCHT